MLRIAVALWGVAAASNVTPIAKVVALLKDMETKGIAEKEEEAVKFSAFNTWCTNQQRIKKNEIEDHTQDMAVQSAAIQKCAASMRELTSRMNEVNEDVARWNKDKQAASEIREREAVDYRATNLDLTESIDALGQAIAVLKKQAVNRPQEDLLQSFLQVTSLRRVPQDTKTTLMAFLQRTAQPDERLFGEAPEAYAYEFQSGGVLDILDKLEDEFQTERRNLQKSELEAKHAFEQMMQQLTDNAENGEHEVAKKTKTFGETAQVKADNEGALAQSTADRGADQKYLDDTVALCEMKQRDFDSRQELREGELAAIHKAIEIISGESVAGSGEKHLPNMLQTGATVLAQLRSGDQNPLQERISQFLAERAHKLDSSLLSLASQRVANDPFTKVKKMIKNLIWKLTEEATAETEHKGWCDTELTTNKQVRDRKTEEVDELRSEIEDLTATVAQLAQDVSDLTAAVQELDAGMAEATESRGVSKDKNEQTIQEAKDAQVAVEQAIAVLKDFYAKSAEATALAQQPSEDAPETFDKPYRGMLSEGGGVVDLLEVILTDFTRLESETTTSEEEEVSEYKAYMFDSKKDKSLKENEISHKSDKRTEKQSRLHSAQEELDLTQDQLNKAIAYFEKLKPTCVDSGISYEERVRRREEEMQSLQEALNILAGTDLA